jgi:hypothetical protein
MDRCDGGKTYKQLFLVEALSDRTVDREAAASERLAAGTGDQSVLYEGKELKFLPHLPAESLINGIVPTPRSCRMSPKADSPTCRLAWSSVSG